MTLTRFGAPWGRVGGCLHGLSWRFALACGLAVASFVSFAADTDDDLPGRVGRVADAAGGLFLASEDQSTEWTEIGVNYPITSGNDLWVSEGGRAELDYGGGQIRLAGATNVHVSQLDDRQFVLFIARGQLIVRVRFLDPGETVTINAPTAQLQLNRTGLYRIDVIPERRTSIVTVREGEALVALAYDVLPALPGETVTITGQDPAVAEIRNGLGVDGFDTWSADRDRHYERNRSTAYVSRQMVGAADLDQYGAWQTYPDYGPVWFPNDVAEDWAPYRDGYWTSVGAWGATWVDAAPWGYAPFHYGRWAWVGGRWGWTPGSFVTRPVWAPALVAWHGGAGWSVSATYGAPVYGWVPLGWRDPYLPSWRGCSARCWTRYNQPYAVDLRRGPRTVPATYVNMQVPGATTAVLGATLTGARPVGANRVRLPPQVGSAAPLLRTAPPVKPDRNRAPPAHAGSPPPPAATLVRPPRTWNGRPDANVGTTVRPGAAAPGSNTVPTAPGAIATPSAGRPIARPVEANRGGRGPQASTTSPQGANPPSPRGADTTSGWGGGTAAAGRAAEAPRARPGSPPSPRQASPAAPQGAPTAVTRTPPPQPYRAPSVAAQQPARAAPGQRADRGLATPQAATAPARPAAVPVPATQGSSAAAGSPQTNLVRPAGRGGGRQPPAPSAESPVAPAPVPSR